MQEEGRAGDHARWLRNIQDAAVSVMTPMNASGHNSGMSWRIQN
jgi:hypothetical protein